MTTQGNNRQEDDSSAEPPLRKPWLKPVLTVRSIEDITLGAKANTRSDTGAEDNYIS